MIDFAWKTDGVIKPANVAGWIAIAAILVLSIAVVRSADFLRAPATRKQSVAIRFSIRRLMLATALVAVGLAAFLSAPSPILLAGFPATAAGLFAPFGKTRVGAFLGTALTAIAGWLWWVSDGRP